MYVFYRAGIALALFATVGCIHPYKLEVQQGNVVTREMIDKLEPGMTKSQVRFVLGTPLIIDPFHPERWDYIYVHKDNATAPAETRKLTVIFNGDAMTRIEGDLAQTPKNPVAPSSRVVGDDARPRDALPATAARSR